MYPTIDIKAFAEKVATEKVNILDVRGVVGFQEGHIDGAQNIPLAILPDRVMELDDDATYYVICKVGISSAKATAYLHEQGFDVINVQQGMDDWEGPVVTGE